MRLSLWSGNALHSKIHYVNWATITLLKAEGGLGIQKTLDVNNACFIKLGWQASTANSIWSHWFKNHCFKFQNIWDAENTIYCSCIWKKICRLAHHIHPGGFWIFGNGKKINLWHDSWTEGNPYLFVSLFCISPWIKDYPPYTNQRPSTSLLTFQLKFSSISLLSFQTSPPMLKTVIPSDGETPWTISSPHVQLGRSSEAERTSSPGPS